MRLDALPKCYCEVYHINELEDSVISVRPIAAAVKATYVKNKRN